MPSPIRRRPLLAAVVGGTAAAGAVGLASRSGLLGGPGDPTDDVAATLRLQTVDGAMASLEVPMGDELMPQVGPRRWVTQTLPTTTHSMVGFTWNAADATPAVQISSRREGTWSEWERITPLTDLPDPDSDEVTGVSGTELVWVGDSDGIRVRVTSARPRDLTLVLLHPGKLPEDDAVPEEGDTEASADASAPPVSGRTTTERRKVARQPTIITRPQWGADPKWRSGTPTINSVLVQVHVHHTVSSNTYAAADVPGMIRGMYRYHTHNLGWSDIGYNFLVDRFGRLFEGRAGGVARLVRGAHTLGFNTTSTGISAIGNFEVAAPSTAMLDAIAALAAWKLSLYGRNPQGRTSVRSEGSDKFSAGRVVSLPVIDGHRDTNDTACPGKNLYAQLPSIRTRTATRIADGGGTAPTPEPTPTPTPTKVTMTTPYVLEGAMTAGAVLRVKDGVVSPSDATVAYQWRRNGTPIKGAIYSRYLVTEADVAATMSVKVAARKPGLTQSVQTMTASTPVRARAVVNCIAKARRDRAVEVRVKIGAPGSAVPAGGTVTVTMSGRTRVGTLTDGVARVVFLKVPPGERTVTASYAGDRAVSPGGASTTVSTR